jgi:serpin B
MLYNGAANATATQMATALHFTLPLDRLDAAFDALDLALTTPPADAGTGAFQISVANSTWTQKGFSILPTYLDNLAVSFGSGVDQVDFVGAPETARAAINSWVSDETQGEIPTLFEREPSPRPRASSSRTRSTSTATGRRHSPRTA